VAGLEEGGVAGVRIDVGRLLVAEGGSNGQ